MYIDGHWVAADSGRTLGVINPARKKTMSMSLLAAVPRLAAAWRQRTGVARLDADDRLGARQDSEKTADLMRQRADRNRPHHDHRAGQAGGRAKAECCIPPTPRVVRRGGQACYAK